jgi:hypothetical protein
MRQDIDNHDKSIPYNHQMYWICVGTPQSEKRIHYIETQVILPTGKNPFVV